ncbi:MAG: hypothetical protein ACK4L7_11050, partial [Flavobacteriales bacterium]
EVQRSKDNSFFETIGRVDARGGAATTTSYSFIDRAPLPGLSYYRLRQVDADGTSELTHAVPVFFEPKGGVLQLFPNPVRDELNLVASGIGEGLIQWRMLDAAGRIAMSGTLTAVAGAQTFVLPTTGLESGAYMLLLQQGGVELWRKRFVKG